MEQVATQTGGTVMDGLDFFDAIDKAAAEYSRDEQIKSQDFGDIQPLKGDYVAEVRGFERQKGEAFGKPKDQYALNVQIVEDERNSNDRGVNWYVSEYYSVLDSEDMNGEVYKTAYENQEALSFALFNMGFNTDETKSILKNPESLIGKKIYIRVWGAKKKGPDGKYNIQKTNAKGYPVHKMKVLAMPTEESAGM